MSVPRLTLLGVPMRRGSISGGRFDLAPAAVRAALDRYVATAPGDEPRLTEIAVDTEVAEDLEPVADLDPAEAFDPIVAASSPLVGDGALLLLGGDNSITRAGVHAVAGEVGLERTGVLTVDAHHDLRDTSGGLTNGNPIRALLEDGLPGHNVVQVGIQPFANSTAAAAVARDAGVTVVTADEVRGRGAATVTRDSLELLSSRADAIYVDLDVDVLDRAFAPACPGSRPGGLMPRELQEVARACGGHPKVRAIDLVEVDPERDVAEATVMTVASLVLCFAAGLARRGD